MKKITMLFFITLFGWLGWVLGEGLGVMGAYVLSAVGSVVGVIVGWWINQRFINY